jgi:O-antigen/teichoic acid export membrane protein
MSRLSEAWTLRTEAFSQLADANLSRLAKSSGVYALATTASPLTSLALAPFLTRYLSRSDYGLLTVLITAIGLVAGLTQLGLGSAFFRAYNYDYSSRAERASIMTTAFGLLFPVALLALIATLLTAQQVAMLLFGRSVANLVILAVAVVAVQNLTVPVFAWLRAEGRAASFALISIVNLAATLVANIVLVGFLGWGVRGSLIATGSGFAAVILGTAPIVLRQLTMARLDVARNMLSFGIPQVPNVLAMWVLQLSDRYLLAQLRSLDETARYAVAYSLGLAVSIVVVAPFSLAWPTAMYAVARRDDARQQFRLIFTASGLLFLFLAFVFSIVGVVLLNSLFPAAYHSAAVVIPLVSESMAFYGMYILLTVGIGLRRKTWLASALTLSAATANVLLNLLLIPKFGALGAATATLVAYLGLTAAAYIVNQRLYPIHLPVGRLMAATAVGMVLYAVSYGLGLAAGPQWLVPVQILGVVSYGGFLAGLIATGILSFARPAALSGGGSTLDPAL